MLECEDVDECSIDIPYCSGLHCFNTVGTYYCGCRDGFEKVVRGNGYTCVDTHECDFERACPKNSVCRDTEGSFSCTCKKGFYGEKCLDIDECETNTTDCDPNAICYNVDGSYQCPQCKQGYYGNGRTCLKGVCNEAVCSDNRQCLSNTTLDCVCRDGFIMTETDDCADDDECLVSNDCAANAVCTNTVGSYLCTCGPGFYGNGTTCFQGQCTSSQCPTNEECVTTETFACQCLNGYKRNQFGSCVDVNECLTTQCNSNAYCSNTEGSFRCLCNEGYYGNGQFCELGSCSDKNCPQNQTCVSQNTIDCKCKEGFILTELGTCIDVDECVLEYECDLKATCKNTIGSYDCECKEYSQGNGKACDCKDGFLTEIDKCIDINECLEINCNQYANCQNTPGSYNCNCKNNFQGNGTTCKCPAVGFYLNETGDCNDINECTANGYCDKNGNCTNTVGSWSCECFDGQQKSPFSCTDDKLLVISHDKPSSAPTINILSKLLITLNTHPLASYFTTETEKMPCLKTDLEAEVSWYACASPWHNKMHVFGGGVGISYDNNRKISRLDGKHLKRIGDLPFDFMLGACATMNNEIIFLCFEYDVEKACRRASNPLGSFKTYYAGDQHRNVKISASQREFNLFIIK